MDKKVIRNSKRVCAISLFMLAVISTSVFAGSSNNSVHNLSQASVKGNNIIQSKNGISFGTTSTTTTSTSKPLPPTPSGAPYVNANGTYFSTLGAPDSALAFMKSQTLFWNKPLPTVTPKTNNTVEQARILGAVAKAKPISPNINGGRPILNYLSWFVYSDNAPGVVLVDSSREKFQKVKFNCWDSTSKYWNWDAAKFEDYINNIYGPGKGIPLPDSYRLEHKESDSPLSIFDYKTDTYITLWRVKDSRLAGAGYISACWAGYSLNFSKDPTPQATIIQLNDRNFQAWGMTENPNYPPGTNEIQPSLKSNNYPMGINLFPTGTGAAGISDFGTMTLMEEVRRGEINHTIGLSLPYLKQGISWPANRTDANGNDNWCKRIDASENNCLQEGQRLRLPANYDISKISDPTARMFAKAARDYGMVIDDYSGCVCIQVESNSQLTNYGKTDYWASTINTTYGTTGATFKEFPWEALEVLPENWGKP